MLTRALTPEEMALVTAEEHAESLRYLLANGYGNPPEALRRHLVAAVQAVNELKTICSQRSSASRTCEDRQGQAFQEVPVEKS